MAVAQCACVYTEPHTHRSSHTPHHSYKQIVIFVRQSKSTFQSTASEYKVSANVTKIDLHNDFSKSFASIFGLYVLLCVCVCYAVVL